MQPGKNRTDKSVISILSVLFSAAGTVLAFINAIHARSWMPIAIIACWFIGLFLAFNSQKATIKWNRILGMVSVGIMALSFLAFLIYSQVVSSSDEHAKLQLCKTNMFNLADAIEKYKSDHNNHYPQTIEALADGKYLEIYMNNVKICPLNSNSYIYQINGWEADHYTIVCPNEPIKHIGKFGPGEVTTELYYSSLKKDIIHNTVEKQQ